MELALNEIIYLIVGGITLTGIAFFTGYQIRKAYGERLIRTAESKAREILVTAKRDAEDELKRADKEAKTYLVRVQADFDQKMLANRKDFEQRVKEFERKEASVDTKLDQAEKREKESAFLLQESDKKMKELVQKEQSLDKQIAEERTILEKLSGLNREEAKSQFLKRLEIDLRQDAGKLIQSIETEATDTAEKKAKKILSLAMQRLAAQHSMESTVTVVTLPSEDMKGRIIGKDGRNIRTFETLTGVDLVIDDTPGAVVLSAFDGVRREIARASLEELIADGRIQPARIEEVVQKTKRNMENVLREEGEKALMETQLVNLHPEIVKLVGRLKYRSSYGQNVLMHSIEVAHIMNVIAGEMGLDPVLARRAGLLHDLGKAVSAETEGPHALIGGELARRYGEHPDVVHGIEAHHEDIAMQSVWPMLVQAADAVSAARPGARRESFETYVKRLKELETIADKHPGVDKSYAIQAGREIRVLVRPDRVTEEAMPALAREIAKKIEEKLTFPGQIKVVVVRESRAEEIAK